jgi:flagellar motor switch/type III secretory pathway protein FliN
MSRVAPILLYAPADLAGIARCLRPVLSAWAEAWMVPGIAAPDVQARAWRDDGLPLQCIGDQGGAWVGAAATDHPAQALVRGLMGSEPAAQEPMGSALAVAEAAREDMAQRLLAALLGREPGAALPAWAREPAHAPAAARFGDLSLHVLVLGVDLHLVASAEAAMAAVMRLRAAGGAAASAAAPPVARQVAIEGARVTVEAVLASAEVTLPELLAMREGDVVLFPHAIGEPVLIRTAEGKPVGRATLGAREGRRAAQLVDGR